MKRVMIADDEQNVRLALRRLIDWDKLGCQLVFEAKNGAEVLRGLDEIRPDILILDIRMPLVSGLDIARQIYEQGRPIAVIILTGYAEFEYARQAVAYNVREYIIKTDVLELLPGAIEKVCRQIDGVRSGASDRDRQRHLRELLEDGGAAADWFRRTWPDARHCRLVLVRADGDIQPQLDRVFGKYAPSYIPLDGRQWCMLLTGELSDPGELAECCEDAARLLHGFYHTAAAFCISDEFDDAAGLKSAYDGCVQCARQFFYDGAKPVLFASEQRTKRALPGDLHGLLDTLADRIGKTDREGSARVLSALLDACRGEDIHTVKSVGNQLLAECTRMTLSLDPDLPRTYTDTAFQDSIYACQSYEQFCQIMRTLVDQTLSITARGQRTIDQLVAQIDRYIQDNYCSRITLGDIAAAVHMNRSYLSRIYKERTGENIFDVINAKRLKKARQLIASTDLLVGQIARQVGFEDPAYFSRFFKRQTGMSPTEYEQKVRGGGQREK